MWQKTSDKSYIIKIFYQGKEREFKAMLYWKDVNATTYYLYTQKGAYLLKLSSDLKLTHEVMGKQKPLPGEFLELLEREIRGIIG